MRVILPLIDDPERLIPVWPALTDALQAVPGIEFVALGSPAACDLMRRHPAVRDCVRINHADLDKPFWSPARWRARRALRRRFESEPDITVIDPFGDKILTGALKCLPGKKSGASGTPVPHDSAFPLPDELHPVQRHRILFAAVLGYSIHDLSPDYGMDLGEAIVPDGVELLMDLGGVSWPEEEIRKTRERLADSGLRIHECDDESLDSLWGRVATARYVLSGPNRTGWLAAAMGRHGLCICPPESAKQTGVISTRRAKQKIINLDNESMSQPTVVVESIILVLTRERAKQNQTGQTYQADQADQTD